MPTEIMINPYKNVFSVGIARGNSKQGGQRPGGCLRVREKDERDEYSAGPALYQMSGHATKTRLIKNSPEAPAHPVGAPVSPPPPPPLPTHTHTRTHKKHRGKYQVQFWRGQVFFVSGGWLPGGGAPPRAGTCGVVVSESKATRGHSPCCSLG